MGWRSQWRLAEAGITGEIPESEQLISRILSIVASHRVFRANGRCFTDFDSTCQATFRCFRNSFCPGCCYESFSIRTRNCWNTCCRFFFVMMTSFKWTIFFSKKQQQPMMKRERQIEIKAYEIECCTHVVIIVTWIMPITTIAAM